MVNVPYPVVAAIGTPQTEKVENVVKPPQTVVRPVERLILKQFQAPQQ